VATAHTEDGHKQVT